MNKDQRQNITNNISELLELLTGQLDLETVEAVMHYLAHDECEMAFEGLFIEIINSNIKLDNNNIDLYLLVFKQCNLDKESIFDPNFGAKFKEWAGCFS